MAGHDSDTLLAQSASTGSPKAPHLVIEGPSWRQRGTVTDGDSIRLT